MLQRASIAGLVGAAFLAGAMIASTQERPATQRRAPVAAVQPSTDRQSPVVYDSEFVDQVIEVADAFDPEYAQRLREMCNRDPLEFAQAVRQSARHLVALVELRNTDPELYNRKIQELKYERQVKQLVEQLEEARDAGDEDRIADLERELCSTLRMQIVLSIKAQGDYILRLRENLAQREAELAEQAANFEHVVQERIRDLIGDGELACGNNAATAMGAVPAAAAGDTASRDAAENR